MKKLALCINRADLVDLFRILRYPVLQNAMLTQAPEEFLRLATRLEDRATCETDPSLLQLLPYVLIHRSDTNEYFTYCRGKGGNEARLHGNLSIGIGGHVDTDVPRVAIDPEDTVNLLNQADLYATSLQDHLNFTAFKEITEELGIQFAFDDKDDKANANLIDPRQLSWTGALIYDDTNSVGQVHLGLLFTISIPNADSLGSAEVGVIEGSQWNSLATLKASAIYDRLENWSKVLIDNHQ